MLEKLNRLFSASFAPFSAPSWAMQCMNKTCHMTTTWHPSQVRFMTLDWPRQFFCSFHKLILFQLSKSGISETRQYNRGGNRLLRRFNFLCWKLFLSDFLYTQSLRFSLVYCNSEITYKSSLSLMVIRFDLIWVLIVISEITSKLTLSFFFLKWLLLFFIDFFLWWY